MGLNAGLCVSGNELTGSDIKGFSLVRVLSFHNLITPAINTCTKCTNLRKYILHDLSSILSRMCTNIIIFLNNTTELSYFREAGSCAVILEILLSWDWKRHSQGPTTEPTPEVSECSSGHLPLLAQNGSGACLSLQHCSFTLSRAVSFKLFSGIFVFSKHILFLFMHQS